MYISAIVVLIYTIVVFTIALTIEYRVQNSKGNKNTGLFTVLRLMSAVIAGICIAGILKHYQILPW